MSNLKNQILNAMIDATRNTFDPSARFEMIAKQNKPIIKTFKIWLPTKSLETPYTCRDEVKALLDIVGVWGKSVLDSSIVPVTKETHGSVEVELVMTSALRLGLYDNHSRAEVYHVAEQIGLDLCPPETAAQLILQCGHEIPNGSTLRVVMDPIEDHQGKLYVFDIWKGSDTVLLKKHLHDNAPTTPYDPELIFLRRNKTT